MTHLMLWSSLWAFAGLAAFIFDWPNHIFVICILASQIHTAGVFILKEQSK